MIVAFASRMWGLCRLWKPISASSVVPSIKHIIASAYTAAFAGSFRRGTFPTLLATVLLWCAVTAVPALAVDTNWTNAGGGDWDTAGNWNNGVPFLGDNALFNLAATYTVNLTAVGDFAETVTILQGNVTFDTDATDLVVNSAIDVGRNGTVARLDVTGMNRIQGNYLMTIGTDGTVRIDNCMLTTTGPNPGFVIENGGIMEGTNGEYLNGRNLENSGTVRPGLGTGTAGTFFYGGNGGETFIQTAAGTLEIELGGTTQGTQYDHLDAEPGPPVCNVNLDGTLDVSLIGGFTPSDGDTFTIITSDNIAGTFATTNMPAGFSITYNATSVVLDYTAPPQSTSSYAVPLFTPPGLAATGLAMLSLLLFLRRRERPREE